MNDKIDNLILVTHKSQISRAYRLCDKLSIDGRRTLILMADGVELKDKRYPNRNIISYQKIFEIHYSNIRQEAHSLFYALAKEDIRGSLLREITSYKGVSLWDLSAQYVFSELIPIIYYFNIAEAILDFHEPNAIYSIGHKDKLDTIFELLSSKRGISFNVVELKPQNLFFMALLYRNLYRYYVSYLHFLKKIKRFFVSLYFFCLNLLKSFKLNRTYKVLFFASPERFLITMLPAILKYSQDERLVINTYLSGSSKKLKENKIFYLDLYGYKLYSIFNWRYKELLRKCKDAIFDEAFFSKIIYRESPIGILLITLLKRVIKEEFPERIREIDIARKIILKHRPKTVVVSDCNYRIMHITKTLSIPVIAMQSMHPGDFNSFGPVMADALTVDGSFWKDYLLKHNVNPNKIWITGSPRFDFLQDNNFALERPNLTGSFTTKPRKIVIFATIYSSMAQGSIAYQNIEQIKSICNAMKNIKEAHLIIKLHPYDNDYPLYRKILKETRLRDYSLIKNVEMLELINSCDLLITHFSAVGYEAVMMGKNVITLCSSFDFRSDDVWDFRRYGVVMVVDDPKELGSSIRKMLFDSEVIAGLKRNREAYISEHAYKLDGNAANRVKSVIDSFCNSREGNR